MSKLCEISSVWGHLLTLTLWNLCHFRTSPHLETLKLVVFQDIPSPQHYEICVVSLCPPHLETVKFVLFQDIPSPWNWIFWCFRTSPHLQTVWERYMGTLIACVIRMYPRSWCLSPSTCCIVYGENEMHEQQQSLLVVCTILQYYLELCHGKIVHVFLKTVSWNDCTHYFCKMFSVILMWWSWWDCVEFVNLSVFFVWCCAQYERDAIVCFCFFKCSPVDNMGFQQFVNKSCIIECS